MLGAIIGDVAGSFIEVLEIQGRNTIDRHRSFGERVKVLDKNTSLFGEYSSCTDDSILTVAIWDAIVNGNCEYEKYLRKYGLREINNGVDLYGRSRFGSGFVAWLESNYQGQSYGNGAAMRISPVGYLFDFLDEVKEQARLATIPSHNHPDAIKGAEAVAVTIFLLRTGHSKEEVYDYIKSNYYDLNYDLEDLQRNYVFSSKSSESVPQALYVFFQSNGFEDSIRKALSIGGDSDTIACIVGSISESYYGISDELKCEVKPYIKDYMLPLVEKRYYSNYEKEKK